MMLFRLLAAVTILLSPPTLWAAGGLDLALLKKNTQIFETIVGEVLRQNFPSPFAVTGEPEGAYLAGYGVVLSFHLNVNRSRIRTPFGEIPAPVQGQRPKDEQLRLLKESMVRCLADYGSTFKQLDESHRISISVHVEDRNELDPVKRTVIMVISASQRDVDLLATKRISLDDFQDKIHLVEY